MTISPESPIEGPEHKPQKGGATGKAETSGKKVAQTAEQAGVLDLPTDQKGEVVPVDISRLQPAGSTDLKPELIEKAVAGVESEKETKESVEAIIQGFDKKSVPYHTLLQAFLNIPPQALQHLKKTNLELHSKMANAVLTMIHTGNQKEILSVFDYDKDLLQTLTDLDLDVINTSQNPYEGPPLCMAASRHTESRTGDKLIRILVGLGADIDITGRSGKTPLHQAVKAGRIETVKLLVSLGADINKRSSFLPPPLWEALFTGSLSMINLLFDLGAHITKKDVNFSKKRGTPLTFNLRKSRNLSPQERLDRVKFLTSLGADCNLPDRDGDLPLEAAHGLPMSEEMPIRKWLIDHGADKDWCQSLNALKGVAHSWTLDGGGNYYNVKTAKSQSTSLTGWDPLCSLKLMRQIFHDFVEDQMKPMDSSYQTIGEGILKIVDRSLDYNPSDEFCEELAHLSEHEPVFVPGQIELMRNGASHAIGVIVYQNKLYWCDRRTGENPGIHEYEFKCNREGRELVRLVDFLQEAIKSDASSQMLVEKLQNLCPRLIRELPQKPLKVGNCTWANFESGLLVLLLLLTKAQTPQEISKCRTLYKAFTKFARKKTLRSYLQIPKPDPSVLKKIKHKLLQQDSPFSEEEKQKLLEKIESRP